MKNLRNFAGKASLIPSFVAVMVFLGRVSAALADGPAVPAGTTTAAGVPAGAAAQPPGMTGMLVPFGLMFAVVYFLMIRPQQKKMKEQQEMLTALKIGDNVVTASGILGRVSGITDKVVTVEIDKDVRVKFLKTQVTQVLKEQIA